MLIDTHCHLDFPQLKDEIDGVLSRAHHAGIMKMISISTRIACFPALLDLVQGREGVFCTVGTHPHHCNEDAEKNCRAQDYVDLCANPKVVGIGEAGLDYHYDHAPRAVQEKSFREQIAAARETGLPIVVHAREADEDIGNILEDEMRKGAFKGVLHCYSSGAALAKRGLEIGFYLSFSGIVTFKNAKEIQAIAQSLPDDRILIETDAPYLAPVPYRGKSNEPSYVLETAKFLAELRGVDFKSFSEATTQNATRLFSRLTYS